MLNNHMEVGRGSTRGRRRGPAGPAVHRLMGTAGALALTWEGSMGALVRPDFFASEEGSTDSFVADMRRAITWESPLAADNPTGTPEPQVKHAIQYRYR